MLAVAALVGGCLSKPPFDGGASDGPPGPPDFDEDGDSIADDVDPCPHLPAPQGDLDLDGIGDDCDYEPMADGETVRFWGFADGNLDELTLVGVSEVRPTDGGALVLGSSAATGSPAYAQVTPHFESLEVDVGFEILDHAPGATGDLRVYTATLGVPNPPEEYVGAICDVHSVDGDPTFLRVIEDATVHDFMPTAGAFLGLTGRLHMLHVYGAALECDTLDLAPASATPVHVARGGPIERNGAVMVAARKTALRIRYIFIVGRRV